MSTQHKVFERDGVEIQLDERSCKFDLDIIIEKPVLEEEGRLFMSAAVCMDVEEVVDIAVRLIGPLMYYEDPLRVMTMLQNKLGERGYL